jgi:uncharacterized protein (TIGR02266 family)
MVERRRYVRIPANWVVRLRTIYLPKEERQVSTSATIRDISPGGVFIESAYPYPAGTAIEFEFNIPERGVVYAKGVVRWANDGSIYGQPIGMGVEFVSVSLKEGQTITVFLEDRLQEKLKETLLKTELHKSLLKFYVPGRIYKISALAQFLSADQEQLKQVLNEYKNYGLVEIQKENVKFSEPKDPRVKRYLKIAISELKR